MQRRKTKQEKNYNKKWRNKSKNEKFVLLAVEDDTHDNGCWILDTGASRHFVKDKELLINPRKSNDKMNCTQPDGTHLKVTMKGNVDIRVIVDDRD